MQFRLFKQSNESLEFKVKINALIIISLWSIIVLISSLVYLWNETIQLKTIAENIARANFHKDYSFRLWASKHGGVYVPATASTPPNPNLAHVPDRDIVKPNGEKLTLMNPAYMIRQLMNEFPGMYGMRGRITSTKYFFDGNKPDEWEQKALASFEKGAKEAIEYVHINEQPYLRLMQPVFAEQKCLKCHAIQGYKVGQVRGGVGVLLPLRELNDSFYSQKISIIVGHTGVWLFGVVIIVIMSYREFRKIKLLSANKAALVESEKKYYDLYAKSPAAYFTIDLKHGRIKQCNYKTTQLFGISTEELKQKNVLDLFADTDDGKLKAEKWFEQLINGHTYKNEEFLMQHNDGCLFWISLSIDPIKNSKGEVVESWSVAIDINDRKKAEENLQLAHAQLESRVEERTEALQNEIAERRQTENYLKEAKIEAEIANRAKSDFLSNISHEIRTPMHQILSFSKFGMDKITSVQPEKLFTYFSRINKIGYNLLSLLNDILDLSKAESGMLDYRMVNCDLQIMISEVNDVFKSLVSEKELIVDIYLDQVSLITCDESRINQVLQNLLSNAIKYSKPGNKIQVLLEPFDIPCSYLNNKTFSKPGVIIKIKDEGIGIPDNELEKIFDKFYQSTLTKTGAGGTGLGLSICREIINAHGGKIWAENNPGGGAIFSFILPAEQVENPLL